MSFHDTRDLTCPDSGSVSPHLGFVGFDSELDVGHNCTDLGLDAKCFTDQGLDIGLVANDLGLDSKDLRPAVPPQQESNPDL